MKRIIRLTESDLTRIVRRVIKENEDTEMSHKVEKAIENPKVEMKIEDVYSNLTVEDKEKLQKILDNLGVDAYSSPKEVHNAIESKVGSNMNGEMTEDESPRNKVANILHSIGAGNLGNWGGVPAAIAIGGLLTATGVGAPMALGFAASWGVSTLLIGLAKLLEEDPEVEENDDDSSFRSQGSYMSNKPIYGGIPKTNLDSMGSEEGRANLTNLRTKKFVDGKLRTFDSEGNEIDDEEGYVDRSLKKLNERYRRRNYRRRY